MGDAGETGMGDAGGRGAGGKSRKDDAIKFLEPSLSLFLSLAIPSFSSLFSTASKERAAERKRH